MSLGKILSASVPVNCKYIVKRTHGDTPSAQRNRIEKSKNNLNLEISNFPRFVALSFSVVCAPLLHITFSAKLAGLS